jgi:hypothetical protein
MIDKDDKVRDFPPSRIVRIPVNSPHDCDDPTSPPPFKDQDCRCKHAPGWDENGSQVGDKR